jgi:hypothetical protein
MDWNIFKNSYIAAITMFFVSYFFLYIFKIGYEKTEKNGKIVKKLSWKLPLIFALITWLFWYFYLFPVDSVVKPPKTNIPISLPDINTIKNNKEPKFAKPKIITDMWIK